MRALGLIIKGRVQRVGYRRYILDMAQELGAVGYSKNNNDGSLTILAQAEEEVLERFLNAARSPPPPAQTKPIEKKEIKPNPKLKSFEI